MSDKVEGFTFTWVIENFSMLPHQNGEELNSDTFTVDQWPNVEWHLELYPKGSIEYEGQISLYFSTSAKKELEPKVTYSLTIVSTESSSDISHLVENYAFNEFYSYGFPNFVSLNIINESKELYLPNDTMTVRCCLRPADERSKNAIVRMPTFFRSCNSRTSIQVNRKSVTLTLPNIEVFRNLSDNTSFLLETALTNSPGLKVTFYFTEIENDGFIRIEIRQTSLLINKEQVFVKCKMTVISAHKKYRHSKESTHFFELSLEDIWHFPDFIMASNLTYDKYLYPDDTTLLLQCEFAFSFESTVYHLESTYTPLIFEAKSDRKGSKLVSNLEKLYLDGIFCDVNLRAGGDETFPAHKVVLCAMSPVFRAMFENDMKEKDSNVVEIEDVDPDTLRRMLAFMHSDALKEDLSFENACKLFRAADKYDVVTLKRTCSLLLVSSLSVDNVCDVLVLADVHQDSFLSTAVHSFIYNHTNETFYSDHWKKFMGRNPKLSGEMMHQMWMKKR